MRNYSIRLKLLTSRQSSISMRNYIIRERRPVPKKLPWGWWLKSCCRHRSSCACLQGGIKIMRYRNANIR